MPELAAMNLPNKQSSLPLLEVDKALAALDPDFGRRYDYNDSCTNCTIQLKLILGCARRRHRASSHASVAPRSHRRFRSE